MILRRWLLAAMMMLGVSAMGGCAAEEPEQEEMGETTSSLSRSALSATKNLGDALGALELAQGSGGSDIPIIGSRLTSVTERTGALSDLANKISSGLGSGAAPARTDLLKFNADRLAILGELGSILTVLKGMQSIGIASNGRSTSGASFGQDARSSLIQLIVRAMSALNLSVPFVV